MSLLCRILMSIHFENIFTETNWINSISSMPVENVLGHNPTIILKLAEPGEKRCYRNRNTSFSAEICWSNVLKYPYFPSKKLGRS